ncbi:MAG: Ig-like domain-containing protein [Longimicrobiales bacterium]
MTRRTAAALFPLFAVLCSWACETDPILPEGDSRWSAPPAKASEPPPEEVLIHPTFLALHMGEEARFELFIGPTMRALPASDAEIEWHSTDPGVAAVTAEGVVTAVGAGEARIRAAGPDFMVAASVRIR